MRRAVLLATLLLGVAAVVASAGASPPRAPAPAQATAAFGRTLHQLYGAIHGYWTCVRPPVLGRIDCLAEVHLGRQWHRVSASGEPE